MYKIIKNFYLIFFQNKKKLNFIKKNLIKMSEFKKKVDDTNNLQENEIQDRLIDFGRE